MRQLKPARLAVPVERWNGIGSDLRRTTDGAGQIHLSLFVGTLPGSWLIDAFEPGKPGAPRSDRSLTVESGGGSAVLPDALTSLLIAAGNSTLANFAQSGQRNVLQWLGEIAGDVHGIGFAPIYGVDATGSTNPGVVLFAEAPAVRSQVLSYLDGSSNVVPDDTQAVVIDVRNMQQLLLGTRLAGHLVDQTPYRLPTLSEWSNGTVIQIASPDVQAFHNSTHIPIPARGRARFGLLGATGNENLLYGYGPSPPFAGGAQQSAVFNHCSGGGFNLTSIVPHSPISVSISGSGGSAGVDSHGAASDSLPGAVLQYRNRQGALDPRPQRRLPRESHRDGYRAGSARPHLSDLGRKRHTGVSFPVRRGVRGSIAITGAGLGNVLRLGPRVIRAQNGLRVSIRGLPHRLARRRSTRLVLRLLDQFGQPAAGVTVTFRGAGLRRVLAASDSRRAAAACQADPGRWPDGGPRRARLSALSRNARRPLSFARSREAAEPSSRAAR